MYNRLAMEGLGTRLVTPLRFWRFYLRQMLWLICPRNLDFSPFCRKRLFYTCKGRYFQFSRHDALRGIGMHGCASGICNHIPLHLLTLLRSSICVISVDYSVREFEQARESLCAFSRVLTKLVSLLVFLVILSVY